MLVCKNNKSVAICQSSFRNKLLYIFDSKYWRVGVSVMVFNATFNNISVTSISWRSV